MTEKEITEEFLQLFDKHWDDPAAHQGFRDLRERVAGIGEWQAIIDARLMALEKKTAESVEVLEEILTREPGNLCALLLLANILRLDNDKPEEAIRIYDGLLKQGFEDRNFPDWLEVLALVNKGVALGQMGKFDEAIHLYEEVIDRFGQSSELTLLEQVAIAMNNKSVALGDMGKADAEIQVYQDLIDRFGQSPELTLLEQVAIALFNKGGTLAKIGKAEEAIHPYEDLIDRFGQSSEPTLRVRVAKAMVNKGVVLGQMGSSEEAIRVYEGLIDRFGQSSEPTLQEAVATAMNYRGVTLGMMGKATEAILMYEEVVERFGHCADMSLRGLVARALMYKADCMLNDDRDDEAHALVTRVADEYLCYEELRSKLQSYYEYLRSRFASRGVIREEERDRAGLDRPRENLAPRLMGYLQEVFVHIDKDRQDKYFQQIEDAEKRSNSFIRNDSRFSKDLSFLLVLREWNSYTPMIPRQEESDRGGGYFIKHAGEGIVIDPGYDFIENFHRAGGLLSDIDHIIVTHAHDDHTAELEALLMLLQRRWTDKKVPNKRQVGLYLAAGVQRKFAGLLDLRDPKYKRIITLCPGEKGVEQRIRLNSTTEFTVLPAYHDDVITRDAAVGLGFEFSTEKVIRRMVFTGDSGLYPVKLGDEGEETKYYSNEDDEERSELDVAAGNALYEAYPDRFRKPELLVAHMGSIKKSEFRPQEKLQSGEDEGRWYYVNHLGLLGTLAMLHQLAPEAALISEFGSELKGFHFELVERLRDALHKLQRVGSPHRKTFVIPGDLTIAYDIGNHRFLCHETCKFADPKDLCCRQAVDCGRTFNTDTKEYEARTKPDTSRTYLFKQKASPGPHKAKDNSCAQKYYQKLFSCKLPYHKK